jgi:hypothetical protein
LKLLKFLLSEKEPGGASPGLFFQTHSQPLALLPEKIGEVFPFQKTILFYKKLTDLHQTSKQYHATLRKG